MPEPDPQPAEDLLAEIGHPKGTLAILAIYMLLFVLGWVGLYVYQFLPRGTPDSLQDAASAQDHAVHGHPNPEGQP